MQRFYGKSRFTLKACAMSLLSMTVMGSSHALYADASNSSSDTVPYDADLFRKDTSVYFVNAEFLYWIVNEGAVDYAVKMNKQPWSKTQDTYAIGNYHNAHFDWSPGFRVNFGHFNAPHYWDVFLQYTYVPSSGSRRTHAPHREDEFLNGTWIQPDVFGNPPLPLTRASCHIDMKYNVLDLLFTRRFQTNEHLRVNLFGGITSALIFQKMKVSYKDIADQHTHIRNRWRFEGAGLRLGLKVDWFMGWDLYLTGQASSGILSGWYKNSAFQKIAADIPQADTSRPIRDTKFHDNRLTYTAQILTGPSWQKAFTNVRTEIFAGYEFTIWTNLHQIFRSGFAAPTASKDTFINNSQLSLQGLTVRVNVDF
jgi:Legionella pneumophila major outer membrane protein precursor